MVTNSVDEALANLDTAGNDLILDLSELHRIDPATIAALEKLSGKVVLRNVNVDVYKVLKLVKLASRFGYME